MFFNLIIFLLFLVKTNIYILLAIELILYNDERKWFGKSIDGVKFS